MRLFPLNNRDIASIRFSPDGRRLAVWSLGLVDVLDTDTGEWRTLWTQQDQMVWDPPGVGFTADGTGVVAVHRPDAARGAVTRVHDLGGGPVRWESPRERTGAADVSHDGRFAYTAVLSPPDDAAEIVVWDLLARTRGPTVGQHARQLYPLAVSPDGGHLAATDGTALLVWEIGAPGLFGAPRHQIIGPRKDGRCDLALSAGGEYLAYRLSQSPKNRLWVWDTRTGRGGEVGPAYGEATRTLAFHPTRPLLAYGDSQEVVFWDATARKELARYAWGIGVIGGVAFSPDGLRCAAASSFAAREGQIIVWDVDV